jgi:hypothetical protein
LCPEPVNFPTQYLRGLTSYASTPDHNNIQSSQFSLSAPEGFAADSLDAISCYRGACDLARYCQPETRMNPVIGNGQQCQPAIAQAMFAMPEDLLELGRPGKPDPYWKTLSSVAQVCRVTRTNVHDPWHGAH